MLSTLAHFYLKTRDKILLRHYCDSKCMVQNDILLDAVTNLYINSNCTVIFL